MWKNKWKMQYAVIFFVETESEIHHSLAILREARPFLIEIKNFLQFIGIKKKDFLFLCRLFRPYKLFCFLLLFFFMIYYRFIFCTILQFILNDQIPGRVLRAVWLKAVLDSDVLSDFCQRLWAMISVGQVLVTSHVPKSILSIFIRNVYNENRKEAW